MSEVGRVCERRKLRVNVGQSNVMRCSRYFNWDQMHEILKGEPLVDCSKSTRSHKWQLMEDVKGMWYTE